MTPTASFTLVHSMRPPPRLFHAAGIFSFLYTKNFLRNFGPRAPNPHVIITPSGENFTPTISVSYRHFTTNPQFSCVTRRYNPPRMMTFLIASSAVFQSDDQKPIKCPSRYCPHSTPVSQGLPAPPWLTLRDCEHTGSWLYLTRPKFPSSQWTSFSLRKR